MSLGDRLLEAARDGILSDVKRLLQEGAPANYRTRAGDSPLYCAIVEKHEDVMDVLLAAGAFRASLGAYGAPFLHAAAFTGFLSAVKKLLHAGAEVDGRNAENKTPLMSAAICDEVQVMHFLVDAGASLVLKDDSGATALDVAREYNSPNAVKFLTGLENEIDSVWDRSYSRISLRDDNTTCMKDAVDEMFALCNREYANLGITKARIKAEFRARRNGNFRIERPAFKEVFNEIAVKWTRERVAPKKIKEFFDHVARPYKYLDVDEAFDVLSELFTDSAPGRNGRLSFTRSATELDYSHVEQKIREQSSADNTITNDKFTYIALEALFP